MTNPTVPTKSGATHDVWTVPRLVPVIRSVADAEENPTSARLKVRALEEFCQLMTTSEQRCHQYSSAFWNEAGSPYEGGGGHTSYR